MDEDDEEGERIRKVQVKLGSGAEEFVELADVEISEKMKKFDRKRSSSSSGRSSSEGKRRRRRSRERERV